MGQFVAGDVNQVMEAYLFNRLSQPFATLAGISMTASAINRRRDRSLQQSTLRFNGTANFKVANSLPSEQSVQNGELKALQDFGGLNGYVKSQNYDWQITSINVNGMTIDGSGANNGNNLVQGGTASSGANRVALSVSLVVAFLVLGMIGLLFVRRSRRHKDVEEFEGMVTLGGPMKPDDDDAEPDRQNISFDAPTLATTSFDSAHLPISDFRPDSTPSTMNWNRIFALSQAPVEETFGEVFEPKKLEPPKEHKTHEIVTLAPVNEGRGQAQLQGEMKGDEDSYGYNMEDEGLAEDLTLSPIAPVETSADYDNARDRDITVDLSDFGRNDDDKDEADA